MSFSQQTLVWAAIVGAGVVGVLVPWWSDTPIPRHRWVVLGVQSVVSVVWLATLGFFGQAHVVYLLATVVPGCVVAAAVVTAAGRRWIRTRLGATATAVLAAAPLIGLYATHVEPYWLEVDEVLVPVDVGAGLRVGVLADLQTPTIGDYERGAVDRLLASEPDLIVIPGDLWQMSDEQIVEDWPLFADLVAVMTDAVEHVVIVEGDTDHIGWLERIGDQTGAIVVHDRVVRLDIDGIAVVIGGTQLVTDAPPSASRSAVSELVAAESADVLTIALSHRPDIVRWLPGSVDLIVSGHTHGGQVQVPFFGPLVTFSDVPRSVGAGGLHELDDQLVYVSTGVGLERKRAPQVRFNARPSIGVLDLVSE